MKKSPLLIPPWFDEPHQPGGRRKASPNPSEGGAKEGSDEGC